jgi:CubicO group peptidase (beta-lactamase class C family)
MTASIAVDSASATNAREILSQALIQDHGAGISAAVIIGGKVVWQDAVGVAHGDIPLSANARMRIGSVSKVFTATIAAKLMEQGVLEVDRSVRFYVPELADVYTPVTVRHLLTHTSGVRQYDFSSFSDSGNTEHFESLSAAFTRHINEPLAHTPGTAYKYSSVAFNLLGLVIERASSASFPDALMTWVARPLKLMETGLDDASERVPCRPHFYTVLGGRFRIPTLWRDNSDLYPSGGMLSSAGDLARFSYATFRGSLLQSSTVATLSAPYVNAAGTRSRYGFGWEVEQRPGQDSVAWVGHGGTINGAYASLRFYPDLDMSVAAIANYDLLFTSKRAAFFDAVRVAIPALFSARPSAEFSD